MDKYLGNTPNGRYYIAIFDSEQKSPKMEHDGTLTDLQNFIARCTPFTGHKASGNACG